MRGEAVLTPCFLPRAATHVAIEPVSLSQMISNILTRIFGSRNERLLKEYGQVVHGPSACSWHGSNTTQWLPLSTIRREWILPAWARRLLSSGNKWVLSSTRGRRGQRDLFYPDGNDVYMRGPDGRYLRYERAGTNEFVSGVSSATMTNFVHGTGTNRIYPPGIAQQGARYSPAVEDFYWRGADGRYLRYQRARTNQYFLGDSYAIGTNGVYGARTNGF